MAAMVHVDQAGVDGILIDLVFLSELKEASKNKKLVIIIEVLLAQEHDQLVKVYHVLNLNSLSKYHQKVKIDK